MTSRINKLLSQLKTESLDALLVTAEANISYLANYRCRDAYLIVSGKDRVYITDSRYTTEMQQALKGFKVVQIKESLAKSIAQVCTGLGLVRLGFEESRVSYGFYQKLLEYLPEKLQFVPTRGLVEALRQYKDSQEINKIRKAVDITLAAYEYIKKQLKPGLKEIEVAAELERFIRYQGASCASFDIIVASGVSSSFPHYLTSERKLQADQPVMIDLGVDYQGYKSDLTRVFFLGKIDSLVHKVYKVVAAAQNKAIAAIKPGIKINQIDTIARQHMAKYGYAKYFLHSLGHGVGLEVHEAPSINARVQEVLQPGMVFTVEPAVYLATKFGIRIEDMVLVTQKGCEVLSGSVNQ